MQLSNELIIVEIKSKQIHLIPRFLNRKQTRVRRGYIYRSSQKLQVKWDLFEDLPDTIIADDPRVIPRVMASQNLPMNLFHGGYKIPALYELHLIPSGATKLENNKRLIHFDPEKIRIKATPLRTKDVPIPVPLVFMFEYANGVLSLMNVKFFPK